MNEFVYYPAMGKLQCKNNMEDFWEKKKIYMANG